MRKKNPPHRLQLYPVILSTKLLSPGTIRVGICESIYLAARN